MNTYEQKCLQLDKELAEALGWTDVHRAQFCDSMLVGYNSDKDSKEAIQRWTMHDGECFRLAVEYDCYPCKWDYESIACGVDCPVLDIHYFPDVFACVRFAICSAVLAKLSVWSKPEYSCTW